MDKLFANYAAVPGNKNYDKLIERRRDLYARNDDVRSPFTRDFTRILHSLAYRRLKHKTQVFYNAADNDHICTRIEHVQHVDSVSNTIARSIGLNEELTRAIAMGHDLGHAPFGHQGEVILDNLIKNTIPKYKDYQNKVFWHEKNGVHFVDDIELLADKENNYQNLNLTYAVRDGIISHCGEVDQNGIKPREEFIDLSEFDRPNKFQAITWEGCVVKLADKIAYLGRDIEDAIRMNYLTKDMKYVLRDMAKVKDEKALNTTVIMHNMIIDLCENSNPEVGLTLSDVMADQLAELKKFNYKNIYSNPRLGHFERYAEFVLTEIFNVLVGYYEAYGADVVAKLKEINFDNYKFVKAFAVGLMEHSTVVVDGIDGFDPDKYKNEKVYGDLSDKDTYVMAVIDFISGMTDNYAINALNELLQC